MPDINLNVSIALDDKITAHWGTTAEYKQWVKATTKSELLRAQQDRLSSESSTALQQQLDVAIADIDSL